MDRALLSKIESAVDNTLLTIVRATVGAGMAPISAISMVRERLDMIEQLAREEARETVVDVLVPDVGDERGQADPEARMASLWAQNPEDGTHSGERGVQSPKGKPRRSAVQPDNQAEYGTWPDPEYGVGLDPKRPNG